MSRFRDFVCANRTTANGEEKTGCGGGDWGATNPANAAFQIFLCSPSWGVARIVAGDENIARASLPGVFCPTG